MEKKRVCIVGAGIGGLSLALRLAHSGVDVTVYEQNENVGGKVNLIEKGGFRFGTGASLLTMPFVIEELFRDVGENIDDYLKFVKLNVLCKYFFPDSDTIIAYSDEEKFSSEIESKTEDESGDVKAYFDYCRKIYEAAGDIFLTKSLTEMSTYMSRKSIKSMLNIRTIDSNRTMHKANTSFFKDDKTIQIFDRYATYNGSSPFLAPATLNIIQHVEYNLGGYICEGGMYKIPNSLYRAAEKYGVKFNKGISVDRIVHENNIVKGVVTENGGEDFDIVVSNADVKNTYSRLLNDNSSSPAKRYDQMEKSSSAIVFYWGIKRLFPDLEIHNILFSGNYEAEFDDIFTKRTIPSDPTVYIYISSKFNKDDAPEGNENWFVMINVPADNEHDWDKLVIESREKIVKKISSILKIDIEKYITFEEYLSPDKIERNTGSSNGSLYGISSNNKMAAFLRQQNRSGQYKGLYFCGGSAHPGGGIPLVVLSANITADLINKYELNHD